MTKRTEDLSACPKTAKDRDFTRARQANKADMHDIRKHVWIGERKYFDNESEIQPIYNRSKGREKMKPIRFGMNSDMTFGKHKDKLIQEILIEDVGYIAWMIEETNHTFDDEVVDYVEEELSRRRFRQ